MTSGKLIWILAVVFVGGLFLTVKSFAQQAPPPVFGCLGLGGQECSFLQVAPPKTNLSVNKKSLKGTKRIVHYGDTITGSVSYTNTGSLPLNVSKVGVAAKTVKGKYEVFFTPSQGQTVLSPGQSINLATTFHKFNYPDPPGDWTVAGRVVNTDDQSVDDNNPDLFTLIADCKPLRAIDPTADADKLNTYCQGKPDDELCKEFCEVKPDLAQNCQASGPGTLNPPGTDPNASQPGQREPVPPENNSDPNASQPGTPNQQPNQNPDPGASNPGQQLNQPGQPDAGPNPDQNPPTPDTGTNNPLEQIQKQFQEFLDELKKLLAV